MARQNEPANGKIIMIVRIILLLACLQLPILGLETLISKENQEIKSIYRELENKPVWVLDGQLTPQGKTAIGVLRNAADDGLNPKDYEDAVDASESHKLDDSKLELLITQRFLDYIHHLKEGRIDPRSIAKEIKIQSPKIDAVAILIKILKADDCCKALRTLAPALPQYTLLKNKLAIYRALETHVPEYPSVASHKKNIKYGMKDEDLPKIRKILIYLGDLDENSLTQEELESSKYDRKTAESIKEFKVRYSMSGDDVIGADTIKALNISLKDLIKKVLVNMERLRWLPTDMGKRYIQVNVAGYEVSAIEDDKIALTIPSIVGRPSRRTPLFYAKLENVLVNPSWGVPSGIMKADKIPKLIRDPNYARRAGFTVTDHYGNVVDPDEVDWASEGMSYHLRQAPGARNALGQVKFNILNPYTIYLHGTPDDKLFRKQIRTFSSGCVRVQDPVTLAEWVLKGRDGWSKDKIKHAIKMGATQGVAPISDIMVYFTYMTLWVDDKDRVRVSNDPYHFDSRIEKALGLDGK